MTVYLASFGARIHGVLASGQPLKKMNIDSLELLLRLASAGLGLGIIPACTVQLLGADLKPVVSSPVIYDSICIVYRPEFGKSEIEKEVIQSLVASIRPLHT